MHFICKLDGITDKKDGQTNNMITRCPSRPFRPGHKKNSYAGICPSNELALKVSIFVWIQAQMLNSYSTHATIYAKNHCNRETSENTIFIKGCAGIAKIVWIVKLFMSTKSRMFWLCVYLENINNLHRT